jgi:hypothetical protein
MHLFLEQGTMPGIGLSSHPSKDNLTGRTLISDHWQSGHSDIAMHKARTHGGHTIGCTHQSCTSLQRSMGTSAFREKPEKSSKRPFAMGMSYNAALRRNGILEAIIDRMFRHKFGDCIWKAPCAS